MSEPVRIDEKDIKIVKALEEDAWRTHAEIGEIVHLSPSAVQRRIERLRDNGVIAGAHADIDWSILRNRTRMYFLVELVNDGPAALKEMMAALTSHPDVAEIDFLSGRFDLLIVIDTSNIEALFEFTMKTLNDDENVRHCWSLTRIKKFV